ncbi:hypothetical protein C8R42DRAFT_692972, partial [Lentinula raphanica]
MSSGFGICGLRLKTLACCLIASQFASSCHRFDVMFFPEFDLVLKSQTHEVSPMRLVIKETHSGLTSHDCDRAQPFLNDSCSGCL